MAWIVYLSRHDSQENLYLYVQIAFYLPFGPTRVVQRLLRTKVEINELEDHLRPELFPMSNELSCCEVES